MVKECTEGIYQRNNTELGSVGTRSCFCVATTRQPSVSKQNCPNVLYNVHTGQKTALCLPLNIVTLARPV